MEPSATSLPKTESTPETRKLWCMVVDLPRDSDHRPLRGSATLDHTP